MVTAGETASFSVTAAGDVPLSYQWSKNKTVISGATASSYSTPSTKVADNGASFTVAVSNAAGSVTSNAATLTVNAPAPVAPIIVTQPLNQVVAVGQTATFSVVVTDTAPLSYQWSENGSAISGATSSRYTTPALALTDSGSTFSVTVSNPQGNAASSAATLTVTAATAQQWVAVPLITQASLNTGNTGGEGGQVLQNIAIDPSGTFLIAGTDVGGIYRSLDGGANWQPANVGLQSRGASSFAIDPNNPNHILALGSNSSAFPGNGLYLSTDQAASWKQVLSQNTSGLGATFLDNLAFDPTSASGGSSQIAYWVANSDGGGGLWKSTDGGNTWQEIQASFSNGIVKVHPTKGYVYVARGSGFYRSNDAGATFTTIINGAVAGLDVIPTAPDNVYINKLDGVYVSSDSGQTFTKMGNVGLDTGETPGLRSLRVSPANPSHMLLDNAHSVYYVQDYYYSTDGGNTWNTSSINSTQSFLPFNGREHAFAWHPTDASTAWSFGGDFITKTTDGGAHFAWANNGYNGIAFVGKFNFNVQNPNLIVVSNQDYDAAFSADGGVSWKYLNASGLGWGGYDYGSYALSSSVLAVGIAAGWGQTPVLYMSYDGGNTWTNTGLNGNTTDTAIGDPSDPSIAFWDNWRTADGGKTWQQMTSVNGVLAYNPAGAQELYGTSGSQVVGSTDQGVTWQKVVDTQDSAGVSDIAFDATNNRLYIVTGALFQYDRTSGVLTNISSALPPDNMGNKKAATAAVDPANTNIVYVGWHGDTYMSNQAVRRSLDGGKTWTPLTLQPGDAGIDGGHEAFVVRVNPSTHYLWVGGECFGIWKYPSPGN